MKKAPYKHCKEPFSSVYMLKYTYTTTLAVCGSNELNRQRYEVWLCMIFKLYTSKYKR